MINIVAKSGTHRRAIATAVVELSSADAMDALLAKKVPKGDVFEMAKTAGLFAVKRTSDMIPDCHPLPIEFTRIDFETKGLEIYISVLVETIYKTGVEVEAMHGASVVALTVYDMLKPLDKEIEIRSIKLAEKSGGKSDYIKMPAKALKASLLVCSNAILSGKKTDTAGQKVKEKLNHFGIDLSDYTVVADDKALLKEAIEMRCNSGVSLVLVIGGTGLNPGDITPEVLHEMYTREVPGIAEVMRNYGQQRTPLAMFSRSCAGYIGNTLVLGIPGSTNGAGESIDALFPGLLHILR